MIGRLPTLEEEGASGALRAGEYGILLFQLNTQDSGEIGIGVSDTSN
jgi:hypothetical protein